MAVAALAVVVVTAIGLFIALRPGESSDVEMGVHIFSRGGALWWRDDTGRTCKFGTEIGDKCPSEQIIVRDGVTWWRDDSGRTCVLGAEAGEKCPRAGSGGGTIAHSVNGHLWTIRADGSGNRPLPFDCSAPDWSPDGSKIACGGGSGISISTPTGEHLTDVAGPYDEPAWSPDGRTIAFTGNDKSVSGPDYSTIHLWLLDLITGKVTKFAEDVGYGASPSWSPDGTRLAYTYYGGGMIADVKTKQVVDGFGEGSVSGAAWVPRGDAIAYSTGHAIVVSGTDGTGQHTIAASKYWLDDPAWSPDAKQIVYAVFRDEGKLRSRGLRVIDVDGTHSRVLTNSGSHPDWQPR